MPGPGGFNYMGPRPPHRPYRSGCGCGGLMILILIFIGIGSFMF